MLELNLKWTYSTHHLSYRACEAINSLTFQATFKQFGLLCFIFLIELSSLSSISLCINSRNNGYAISTPTDEQYRGDGIG